MTYLAVSILATNEQTFADQLKQAIAAGAEAIEIRMDSLDNPCPEVATGLIAQGKKTKLPIIVTCRDKAEGGVAELQQSVRLSILRQAVIDGVDFIDVEFDSYKHPDVQSVLNAELDEATGTRLILSAHNFVGPFADLNILYESILSLYPDAIPKIVYKARHINDCFAAFDLLTEADRPTICFCMGAAGQISRILAKKFGAFLTFASLDADSETAPGQVPIADMKNLYRWDDQNSETEIFGLIGNPVSHSVGPELFNTCFKQEDINAIYLPLLVEGDMDEFDAFMTNVTDRSKAGFGGFSVTIPHKTHALDYTNQHGDYTDNLAESIGAVNTLKIGFNGLVSAYNTDYSGAMDALTTAMEIDKHTLHKTKVAVLGAGGVARAVVAGLCDVGARVTVYNRTATKAHSLAKEFNCRAAGVEQLEAIDELDATVVVNCTSLGMHPDVETTPMPAEKVTPTMTVFDTVYNPLQTKLLADAQEAGATCVNGAEMFIRQAMAQHKIFVGTEGNQALMRDIVYARLTE
ncbi:MAG: shikimate dehydrogenase [Planctomycetota bacterium]|jgi:3-dehydroquinate dehydratase/shikimate dehydrogenase